MEREGSWWRMRTRLASRYPALYGFGGMSFGLAIKHVGYSLTYTISIGISAVVGMLALNGLPMPYHPVFNVPSFALATRDRFFLVVRANDDKFDIETTRRFLQELGAQEVSDVRQ